VTASTAPLPSCCHSQHLAERGRTGASQVRLHLLFPGSCRPERSNQHAHVRQRLRHGTQLGKLPATRPLLKIINRFHASV
jgi:hypothetical protein